mgnify:CR=1 FL=1
MVGPKIQDFPKNRNAQRKLFLNNRGMNYGLSKSAKSLLSKSIIEPLYFLNSCPIFDEPFLIDKKKLP